MINTMEVDGNGLEVLEREECLRLLAGATLGRIGLTSGDEPVVLPINFWLDQDRILILTGEGSKLDAAARNVVVAFEVDDFDPMYHSGWSVLVTGRTREVTDPDELAALRSAPLTRWAPQGIGRLVAIATDRISGRRIAATERVVPPLRRDLEGLVAGDVEAAVKLAAERAFEPLRSEIKTRVCRLLSAAGVEPSAVSCRFEPDWPRLNVVLVGPAITSGLEQSLAIPVLDAVRADERTYGQVLVSYEASNP